MQPFSSCNAVQLVLFSSAMTVLVSTWIYQFLMGGKNGMLCLRICLRDNRPFHSTSKSISSMQFFHETVVFPGHRDVLKLKHTRMCRTKLVNAIDDHRDVNLDCSGT
jgi:hypothetical protein